MTGGSEKSQEERVLVLAPTGKDGALAQSVLEAAGINSFSCASLEQVCAELARGSGAVLLAEEAILQEEGNCLDQWLYRQPPWSDLPLLILSRPGADSAVVAQAMELSGNVTVLERPARVVTLVSAVRTALRARWRQYQTREHLLELERTAAALREADRRKDEFLAILAHELRNPLAPIRNSLHVLRLTAGREPAIDRVSEMMERQVDHMVRLVDDLMEVARITRGKMELRKEPVEVAVILDSAVEASRPLIEAAGHKLVVSIPPEPLTVEGDPIRLSQVFANLLNNAATYTNQGGKIRLTVERDGKSVVISVRDSGAGIPAEMLPVVFEPFRQLESPTGRVPGGLGIGLTLVKSLIEMHGGSVEAHSGGIDRGSEFRVRLPLAPGVQPTGDGAPTETRSVGAGGRRAVLHARRVLVVDDNRDAAESLAMLLELLGADARVVYSGAEALDLLETYRPAVVLLDIGMPDMDGFEVAQRIRQRPEFDNITLIALTGWGQEEDRRHSREAGFDHHLVKPADVGALETLLVTLDERSDRV